MHQSNLIEQINDYVKCKNEITMKKIKAFFAFQQYFESAHNLKKGQKLEYIQGEEYKTILYDGLSPSFMHTGPNSILYIRCLTINEMNENQEQELTLIPATELITINKKALEKIPVDFFKI